MHVRAAQEEIQVGHGLGHDQEHKHPRQDEGHEETKQRHPREFMRSFPPLVGFRVRVHHSPQANALRVPSSTFLRAGESIR